MGLFDSEIYSTVNTSAAPSHVATLSPDEASWPAGIFSNAGKSPELMDLQGEAKHVLDLYGAEPGKASFANNALLARRLVQRGVRFVQLYHTNWDQHGGAESLDGELPIRCKEAQRT